MRYRAGKIADKLVVDYHGISVSVTENAIQFRCRAGNGIWYIFGYFYRRRLMFMRSELQDFMNLQQACKPVRPIAQTMAAS